MQLGKVREPQGVETTGPGLMQEVKEEKSGEARKQSDRKGRRRVSRNRETGRSFHQQKETEKQPQLPTLPHFAGRWAGLSPRGHYGVWHVAVRELGYTPPVRPLTANQGRPGGPGGSSEPSWASSGLYPVPPTWPHSLGA